MKENNPSSDKIWSAFFDGDMDLCKKLTEDYNRGIKTTYPIDTGCYGLNPPGFVKKILRDYRNIEKKNHRKKERQHTKRVLLNEDLCDTEYNKHPYVAI